MGRLDIWKMTENQLTEVKICVAAPLHAQVFSVHKSTASEGAHAPRSMPHVLRPNCPSLPVKLDYPSAHRHTVACSCHPRRVAVRLSDFSPRLGDALDKCYYPRPSLDGLVQAPGMWECLDTTSGASPVRSGQQRIANRSAQSGYRRHIGSTPIGKSVRQHHSTRPHHEEQPAAVSAGATLGYAGPQRAGQWGMLSIVFRSVPIIGNRNNLIIPLTLGRSLTPVMMNKPVWASVLSFEGLQKN